MRPIIAAEPARVNSTHSKSEFIELVSLRAQKRSATRGVLLQDSPEMDGAKRSRMVVVNLLLGISSYYADHPRCELEPGIIIVSTALSDELFSFHAEPISLKAMSAFLHASEEEVLAAINNVSVMVLPGGNTSGAGK